MDLSQDEIRELNRRLDAEWDVDRLLHLITGGGVLLGLFLGWARHPRWSWLSLAMGDLALWAAFLNWNPIKALLLRVGVRTRADIERERYVVLFGKEPHGIDSGRTQ